MATQLSPDHRLHSALAATSAEADHCQAEYFRTQAQRCRRLSAASSDAQTVSALTQMADEYDERATLLSGRA